MYQQNPLNPYKRRSEILEVASSIQCCFSAFSTHPDILTCSMTGEDLHRVFPPFILQENILMFSPLLGFTLVTLLLLTAFHSAGHS